jgi:hypothetical protein
MITEATVRKLALALPEAEEQAHHGHPDFRVRNKIFATLRPGENRAVVLLKPEDPPELVRSDPQAFSLNAWSRMGAVNVHLEHIDAAQFRCLLDTAWRKAAPKKLAAKFIGDDQ